MPKKVAKNLYFCNVCLDNGETPFRGNSQEVNQHEIQHRRKQQKEEDRKRILQEAKSILRRKINDWQKWERMFDLIRTLDHCIKRQPPGGGQSFNTIKSAVELNKKLVEILRLQVPPKDSEAHAVLEAVINKGFEEGMLHGTHRKSNYAHMEELRELTSAIEKEISKNGNFKEVISYIKTLKSCLGEDRKTFT